MIFDTLVDRDIQIPSRFFSSSKNSSKKHQYFVNQLTQNFKSGNSPTFSGKKQIFLFKIVYGAKSNLNMLNLLVMFTFYVLHQK